MNSFRFSKILRGAVRSLGMLLCSMAVSAQIGLPLIHEWQVAREEGAYAHIHGAPISGAAIEASGDQSGPRHHHHDSNTCAACPALARLHHFVFNSPLALDRSSQPPLRLAFEAAVFPVFLSLVSSSPRSPPAV